jgi:hypothetical protein
MGGEWIVEVEGTIALDADGGFPGGVTILDESVPPAQLARRAWISLEGGGDVALHPLSVLAIPCWTSLGYEPSFLDGTCPGP